MKRTKVMVAVIVTFLATWFAVAFIGSVLSDFSIRECAGEPGILMLMFIFGWIPAVIVGVDMDEQQQ